MKKRIIILICLFCLIILSGIWAVKELHFFLRQPVPMNSETVSSGDKVYINIISVSEKASVNTMVIEDSDGTDQEITTYRYVIEDEKHNYYIAALSPKMREEIVSSELPYKMVFVANKLNPESKREILNDIYGFYINSNYSDFMLNGDSGAAGMIWASVILFILIVAFVIVLIYTIKQYRRYH